MAQGETSTSNKLRLIDTDIHNSIQTAELLPYLSNYWREWVRSRGNGTVGGIYTSPIGVMRSDAIPPNGGPAGSDPKFLGRTPHG